MLRLVLCVVERRHPIVFEAERVGVKPPLSCHHLDLLVVVRCAAVRRNDSPLEVCVVEVNLAKVPSWCRSLLIALAA